DHYALASIGPHVVSHSSREIERRDPIGRPGLNDMADVFCTAKLVAEFRLVPVKRYQLVAPERLQLVGRRRHSPAVVEGSHRINLVVAPGVQDRQKALQLRILKNAHRANSLRWHDPGRLNGLIGKAIRSSSCLCIATSSAASAWTLSRRM